MADMQLLLYNAYKVYRANACTFRNEQPNSTLQLTKQTIIKCKHQKIRY